MCGRLSKAKEIQLEMRSKGMQFDLRYEFPEETKGDIFYKCTEYYDCDSNISLCVFDENGLRNLEKDYNGTSEDIKDIQEWYSETPIIHLTSENEMENEELYSCLLENLGKLKKLLDIHNYYEFDNFFDNCWKECGEMLFSEIFKKLSSFESCNFELEIYAIPDGQDDYDFASVGFIIEDGQVKTKYIRF